MCESLLVETCVFDPSELQFMLVSYYPESFYTQDNTLFALFMLYMKKKPLWMVPFRDYCYIIMFRADWNATRVEQSDSS